MAGVDAAGVDTVPIPQPIRRGPVGACWRLDVDADLPYPGRAARKHAADPVHTSPAQRVSRPGVGRQVREAAVGLLVTGPVVVPGWWAIWKACDGLWALLWS